MLPYLLSKEDLNDLIRDLNFSKDLLELLASILHKKKILQSNVKISFYRNREEKLLHYFSEEDDFVYCNQIFQFCTEYK